MNRAERRNAKKHMKTGRRFKMADKRAITDIQADYNQAAAAAGDRGYRIKVLQSELDNIIQRMSELNKEASEASTPAVEPVAPVTEEVADAAAASTEA